MDNKDIFANFIIFSNNIEYYCLGKNLNFAQNQINKPIVPEKNFWDKTIPSISGIENLEWKANIYGAFTYKKYLDNKNLESDIKSNYKKKLIDKKREVKDELELNKNVDFDYIKLLKIIIKDNTNKDLVRLYLQILKKDKEGKIRIDFDGKESFDDEYEKYKNMFTIDELKLYGFKVKKNLKKIAFFLVKRNIGKESKRYIII